VSGSEGDAVTSDSVEPARPILQIVRGVLTAWLHGERADMAGARAEIEALLRDEFGDAARSTLNEIRLDDE